LIVFTITYYLPGDIARVILGREAGAEEVAALRDELGLNDPPAMQYFRWLLHFISGNWGQSFSTQSDVFPLVINRLWNSAMLAGTTLLIALPLSLILGIFAGLNEHKLSDNIISIASLSVVGLPEFVTGLLLIQIFAFKLDWLPANSSIPPGTGYLEALPMLILPALTATLVLIAYIARMTRAGVLKELKKEYVRTANLKGIPHRQVISRHVLRNALLPTITVIAISIGWLIGGLIVIENVFNYPGIGRLLVFAIDRRDYPLIQAIAMITVLFYALANLGADLLYAYLDPRIQLE
jgi:peptide/nickel transport system permease protein